MQPRCSRMAFLIKGFCADSLLPYLNWHNVVRKIFTMCYIDGVHLLVVFICSLTILVK